MSLKVLIADDSLFMRGLIKKILKRNGVDEVIEAQNGEEAVNLYKEHTPALVFLDRTMPVKNGFIALKEIKGINPDAKVVMCTALGQVKFVDDAVKAGALAYITKPFHAEEVEEVLLKVKG